MTIIRLGESSKLKRTGERAFLKCSLSSIRIPVSVEESDGSALVGCPLLVIEIAAGSRYFTVEADLIVTAGGTSVARYFGRQRVPIGPRAVEVLGKSCFESTSIRRLWISYEHFNSCLGGSD
jgi:hypothetical protein